MFINPFDSVGYNIKTAKYLGFRNYELSNHLGNVLAVISDLKYGEDANTDGELEIYKPNVLSETDYYAFGSEVKERSVSGGYKFGFGGHIKDDDVSGEGNSVDMGDRWINTRLGRKYKTDKKEDKYPDLSPYSYAGNNPIFYINPDGKDIVSASDKSHIYVTDAIVSIFKSSEIAYKLFDLNEKKSFDREGKLPNKDYGRVKVMDACSDWNLKEFQKGLKQLAKENKVKFTEGEITNAFKLYQKINAKRDYEVLVVKAESRYKSGGYDVSQGKTEQLDLSVKSKELQNVVGNLYQKEEDNCADQGPNNSAVYNNNQIEIDKDDYLKKETNGTGEKIYDSGSILIDGTGKSDKEITNKVIEALQNK